MRTTKEGLLVKSSGLLAFELPGARESIAEEETRDLGGTVEFTPEEVKLFMHITGMQSAMAMLRKRKKRKKEEEEEEADE